MEKQKQVDTLKNKFRGKFVLLFRNNAGVIIRFTLTGLFIGLAVWFFNHQKTELHSVGQVLFDANRGWLVADRKSVV